MSPQQLGGAAIWSLAVEFPARCVTNAYLQRRHPEVIAAQGDQKLAKIWTPAEGARADPWTEEMGRYLDDPFRGAKERRWLPPGGTALSLELAAARSALEAAGLHAEEIDLALVASFLPDHLGTGNAAFLAAELRLRGAAWNLETACSSALVALETAAAFVRSGQARRVLVVASCTYSRNVEETDSLAWSVGDGACAFVVGGAERGAELLSFTTLHTASTCGAMSFEPDAARPRRLRLSSGPSAGRKIREAAHWAIRACCESATRKAGMELSAPHFYAVATPVAWYARFFARTIGVPDERVMNTHPRYANTGLVLMPQNLFHAAREGRLRRGGAVLLHTVASVATASAAVIRWGDVALGRDPPPPVEAG